MQTYFSTDLAQKTIWEKNQVIEELERLPENTLATIQWNMSDDTLYGVSYVNCDNASDNGYIWHYEPIEKLLEEIKAQL